MTIFFLNFLKFILGRFAIMVSFQGGCLRQGLVDLGCRTSIVIAALTFYSVGAQAADVPANVSARILPSLTLTSTKPLEFATIIPSEIAVSSVTLAPSGERFCSSGLTCAGEAGAATFEVFGRENETFSVTLPGPSALTSGKASLVVGEFSDSLGGTGALDNEGRATFSVGARANVRPDQPLGNYSGTFLVIVEYN